MGGVLSKGSQEQSSIDRVRDELFSHIRRCGVLEAENEQREKWFTDTIQYLREQYPELSEEELTSLRTIGERYCAPPIPHGGSSGTGTKETPVETVTEVEENEMIDAGEVNAA